MYILSKRSKNRLKGVVPVLIQIIIEALKTSPYDFGIPAYGGRRSSEDQAYLYSIGRTIELHKDPITWTLDSYHITGKAFDIFAYVNGRASWDLKYLIPIKEHLIKVAKEKFGVTLYNGYDLWKKDAGHYQIK